MAMEINQELIPKAVVEAKRHFRLGSQVIFHLNTEDLLIQGSGANRSVLSFPYALAKSFHQDGFRIALYSPSQGIKELLPTEGSSKPIPQANGITDQPGIMSAINRLLHDTENKWLVIVLHPEAIAPRSNNGGPAHGHQVAEFFHTIAKDPYVVNGPSRIAMICYTGLPSELITNCPRYEVIEAPLPSKPERLAFMRIILDVAKRRVGKMFRLAKGLTAEHVARLTSGMTLIGLEKFFLNATYDEQEITPRKISQAKARDIRKLSRGTLEVCDPEYGFEMVGGLRSLKLYFSKIAARFKQGEREVPRGILLAGPPGTGKTYVAKASAHEIGWTFVKLARIRGSLYGQSEERQRHALSLVEQMGHVVLFLDEIDQSLGQRSSGQNGDSGTTARMWADFMAWMAEPRLQGKVLIVAATNRPDLLDAATVDRFDVVAPLIRPSKAELVEITEILLKRKGRRLGEIKAVSIAEALDGLNLTIRNLETILDRAGHLADEEAGKDGQPVRLKNIKSAVKNFIPRDSSQDMEQMELTALDMCDHIPLLPWNGPKGRLPDMGIPRHLQMIVTKDGRLDKVELAKELNQFKERQYAGRRVA
jgi:hypothetical protein